MSASVSPTGTRDLSTRPDYPGALKSYLYTFSHSNALGWNTIAKRNITAGDLIIQETPLLVFDITGTDFDQWLEEEQNGTSTELSNTIESLTSQQTAAFSKLAPRSATLEAKFEANNLTRGVNGHTYIILCDHISR